MLPSLTDQEMDWLELGELQMVLEKAGGPELRISGYITTRQSCDGEEGWGLALWVHITQRHKRVLRKSPKYIWGSWVSGCGQACCHLSCPLQSFKVSFVGLMP